ncbi:MAG: hypothetical protein ABSB35_10950 [Bryobacteraceae bacterium]
MAFACKESHKYLTLVYQIDQGFTRLLWVGKERTIESFQGFFPVIGEQVASEILFACSATRSSFFGLHNESLSAFPESRHI